MIAIGALHTAAHACLANEMDYRCSGKLQAPPSQQAKGRILAQVEQAGGSSKEDHRLLIRVRRRVSGDHLPQLLEPPVVMQVGKSRGYGLFERPGESFIHKIPIVTTVPLAFSE
jgi:hypothetical protein